MDLLLGEVGEDGRYFGSYRDLRLGDGDGEGEGVTDTDGGRIGVAGRDLLLYVGVLGDTGVETLGS